MAYMERRDYCRIGKIYENARETDAVMRHRIATVKSNIDNHAPADTHLRRNTKKEIMMEGACAAAGRGKKGKSGRRLRRFSLLAP
jgi:hypothetical protein